MRQAARRAIRNQSARSAVRTYVKKAGEAVLSTAEGAAEVVRAAVRALDKAAHKGIVHPNAAARRKSRLMGRLHQLTTTSVSAESSAADAAPKAKAKATAAKAPAKRATTTSKAASAEKKPAAASPTRKPAARKPAAKE
jgi:small subunit ribosomal protein S20